MSGHVSPKSVYITIFGTLMVLTGITIAIAFVNLGLLNFPIALSIAIIKATLVVLFFMHVKYSSRLTKLVIATGVFFLLVLFTLTLTDYLSRGWQTYPPPRRRASVDQGCAALCPTTSRSSSERRPVVGAILDSG